MDFCGCRGSAYADHCVCNIGVDRRVSDGGGCRKPGDAVLRAADRGGGSRADVAQYSGFAAVRYVSAFDCEDTIVGIAANVGYVGDFKAAAGAGLKVYLAGSVGGDFDVFIFRCRN
ncbi:hypothetical protein CCP3SC15_300022 [Gammaproteobacteria bacterium]